MICISMQSGQRRTAGDEGLQREPPVASKVNKRVKRQAVMVGGSGPGENKGWGKGGVEMSGLKLWQLMVQA